MDVNTDERKVYTVKEIAKILQTSRQQVRRMIQGEELEAVRVGREWRITDDALNAFLNKEELY